MPRRQALSTRMMVLILSGILGSGSGTRVLSGQTVCYGGPEYPCYKIAYFQDLSRRIGFEEASQACEMDGGALVSIRSATEQRLIESLLQDLTKSGSGLSDGDFWIGLRRSNEGQSHNTFSGCPDLYRWTDGSAAKFSLLFARTQRVTIPDLKVGVMPGGWSLLASSLGNLHGHYSSTAQHIFPVQGLPYSVRGENRPLPCPPTTPVHFEDCSWDGQSLSYIGACKAKTSQSVDVSGPVTLPQFLCRNWYADEPSCGSEACVVMYHQLTAQPGLGGPYLYQWNDDRCNMKHNFVCKYASENLMTNESEEHVTSDYVSENVSTGPEVKVHVPSNSADDQHHMIVTESSGIMPNVVYVIIPTIPLLLLLVVALATCCIQMLSRSKDRTKSSPNESTLWISAAPKKENLADV